MVLLAGTSALLTGCGEPPEDAATPAAGPADPGSPGARDELDDSARPVHRNLVPAGYTGRFQVNATVLQDADHGPRLCYTVMESYPPQCGGGVEVAGFSWRGLDPQTEGATRWGGYRLVGTWDGARLILTEPPVERTAQPGADAAPVGGDHAGRGTADRDRELAAVQARLGRDHPELLGSRRGPDAVTAEVPVATKELSAELDRDYGRGNVLLDGWLTPLD